MSKLRVFQDESPLLLSGKEKESVIKKINEEISCLLFFRDLVQEEKAVVTNVWTCLGLNESYHSELSKMVGYESILTKEKEERHKEIREKNENIRKLTEQRGKEVTPEAIQGALRRYEDIFRAWYGNEGFRYASISTLSAYGITAELTPEMNFRDSERCNNEIYKKIGTGNSGTEDKIADGWDIYKSQFHAELLDTENNKKRINELLLRCFPNIRIFKFTGINNDYNGFSLRMEMHITYSDLDRYFNSL